jgi:hypothetical protein
MPHAVEFESIAIGRLTCDHCEREFLVIDNVPMTEAQYTVKGKIQ